MITTNEIDDHIIISIKSDDNSPIHKSFTDIDIKVSPQEAFDLAIELLKLAKNKLSSVEQLVIDCTDFEPRKNDHGNST